MSATFLNRNQFDTANRNGYTSSALTQHHSYNPLDQQLSLTNKLEAISRMKAAGKQGPTPSKQSAREYEKRGRSQMRYQSTGKQRGSGGSALLLPPYEPIERAREAQIRN